MEVQTCQIFSLLCFGFCNLSIKGGVGDVYLFSILKNEEVFVIVNIIVLYHYYNPNIG